MTPDELFEELDSRGLFVGDEHGSCIDHTEELARMISQRERQAAERMRDHCERYLRNMSYTYEVDGCGADAATLQAAADVVSTLETEQSENR